MNRNESNNVINRLTNNVNSQTGNTAKNSTELVLVAWNLRGSSDPVKSSAQRQKLRENLMSVAFLSEIGIHTVAQQEIAQKAWAGSLFTKQVYFNCSDNATARGGVGIILSSQTESKVELIERIPGGRCIIIKGIIGGCKLILCSVHLPNSEPDQVTFLKMLHNRMKYHSHADYDFVIGGDHNLTRVNADRLGGRPGHRKKANAELSKILEEFELTDAFRDIHDGPAYTWKANNVARRLDYIFSPKSWKPNVKSIEIVPAHLLSDHELVVMTVESDNFFPRGSGTWKMNNSLLDESMYCEFMSDCIAKQLESTEHISDPHLRYELLKCMIAANTRSFSKRRAQRFRDEEKRLAETLQSAIEAFSADLSEANVAALNAIERELKEISLTRAKGAILRSRMKWLQQGERPNSFFLNLEKSRSSKKAILSLKADDGSIIRGKEGIQTEIDKYMMETISDDKSTSLLNSEELINSVADVALGEADYEDLNRLLEVSEIETALINAPKDKTPGVCGITAQVWLKFWPQVKELFMEVINSSFQRQYLPQSLRRALVTFIPKPGRDLETMKGYRGISLLCCDYKIIASALAARIKKVITKLVHSDQTGFIQGRQITDNIRATQDLLWYTNENDVPGYLILTDASMAYDKLQFNYIDATLEAFNFPPRFRSYIKMMRSKCEKSAINHGHRGRFQPVQRGVFQGDPLASYLYLLAQETLSAAIRKDDKIKGIIVNPEGTCFKGMSYADDQSYTLQDRESIEHMVEKVELFGKCSGVVLNKAKTEAIGMGLLKNIEETVAGIKIWPKSVKLLGHWLGYNTDETNKRNYHDKLSSINSTLSPWISRGLTLRGKILVSKVLGVSQVIYSMMAGTVPPSFLNSLNKLLDRFLWNQGVSKIARHVLIQDYKDGGLKQVCMHSLHMSLKASWIKRICEDPDRKAFLFGVREMNRSGGIHKLMESNYSVEMLDGNFNPFYKQVLQSYQTASPLCGQPQGEQVLNQLWVNNQFVKHVFIRNKSFYCQELRSATFGRWFNHQTGLLKNYEEILLTLINPIPEQLYKAIRRATPRSWLIKARSLTVRNAPQPDMVIFKNIKSVLIQKQWKLPAAFKYWKANIESFNDNDYFELFRQNNMNRCVRVYNNTYRMLSHSIITRTRLLHLGLRNDGDCPNTDTCKYAPDTALHSHYWCPRVKPVLESLVAEIFRRENVRFPITEAQYILGIVANCPLTTLIETILGLARLFIVNFRYRQTKPDAPQLTALLIFVSYKLNLLHKTTEESKKTAFRYTYRNFM